MTRFELLHEVARETAALPPGALFIQADSAAAAERLWRSWESWLHVTYLDTLTEFVGDIQARTQLARLRLPEATYRSTHPLGLPARQADLVERWTDAARLLDSVGTAMDLWAQARFAYNLVLDALLRPPLVNTLRTLISAVAGAHGCVAYSERRVEGLLDAPVEWVAYGLATGGRTQEEFHAAVELIHTGLDKIELELLELVKE